MAKTHSKRITLGTYSRRGLFNSFAEGDYTREGLRTAVRDAEHLARKADPARYNPEELGICAAVFSLGVGVPTRIVARFRFGREWPVVTAKPACEPHFWYNGASCLDNAGPS